MVNKTATTDRHVRRPIAVDLFAGAGGLGLGFEQAGFDVVAAVEYDPIHAATHQYNFPRCEVLCRSVSSVSGQDILAAAARGFSRQPNDDVWTDQVDVVIGGPPCQGFSIGGKRDESDDRNLLIMEFVRLVEEVRPKAFCMENVAGLLESRFDGVRDAAFGRLRDAGYSLSGIGASVNAVNYGVPQRRKRLIVIGCLTATARDLVKSTGVVTTREALDGLPAVGRYSALLISDAMLMTATAKERRSNIKSQYARELAGLSVAASDLSYPRDWDKELLTCSRRTVHTPETRNRFAETRPGQVEPRSRLYRLPLQGPARTLRAGTGTERGSHTSPRPIHPTQDRVITVREAARLHGYPDWFRFHTTNWHGHRQVGNSVPPPLAKAAAEAVRDALGQSPSALRPIVKLGDPFLLQMSPTAARANFQDIADAELPAQRVRRSRKAPDLQVLA